MEGQVKQMRAWWKECSVYQGIISRVDYLSTLGVDIVWLSPIFKSPQLDMRLRSNTSSIGDVDLLRDMLHERGMKLALDLVLNQHEWFQKSRKSKNNPYRDWYIWKSAKFDADGNRCPPNNWQSHFQGSAWEYDEATDEYYLRLFCKEQPDLNWDNLAIRKAAHDVMRFWLDRKIDGFRIDVINFISKDPSFPDSSQRFLRGAEYYACGPRCHEYLQEIGAIIKEYVAFSVGEMPCVHDEKELIKAVAADRAELAMIFYFELMDLDHGVDGKFSPKARPLSELKTKVNKWQRFMYDNNGWNALYLENHDQPRASAHRSNFIYQGQEIGMTNVPIEWGMEDYKDIDCLNHWDIHKDSADEVSKSLFTKEYQKKSRDNAQTPMQWDDSPQAGFTTSSTPWMRVHDNYKDIKAASQVNDPTSVFHMYQLALEKRKEHKNILVYGESRLRVGR
ncbi:hypothetical protein E4U60_003465 [Claviceps pazoutovae]|uniref:Glycosyl hydrolase family 13 catalytic domain-containing protein n=1 Tax=Claviceps pazoutovae TaxID=1649127 RepID=A0A9P7SKL4_9HYPO|nr:hypothetical protein E4U60_003465 [Claviceps pazoutovae]